MQLGRDFENAGGAGVPSIPAGDEAISGQKQTPEASGSTLPAYPGFLPFPVAGPLWILSTRLAAAKGT